MMLFGGLSKEVRAWQREFSETLNAVEGRALEETPQLVDRLRQSLDRLDQLQVDGAQKRKALADALIKYPKAIAMVANLRGARSGEQLLANVQVGLQRARAQTRTPDETRRAATEEIQFERELRTKGAAIDRAFQLAPSAHLTDIKNLTNLQDSYVLKAFLRDHPGTSIHLDLGIFMTPKGLRLLDPNKNKLVRLKEEHVANVYEGDLKAVIALRVAQIADRTIGPHVRRV
jgi:hypothetical protein